MDLSDSADSTMKARFEIDKPKLDLKPLSNYLRYKYGASRVYTYVIPFSLAIRSIGTGERSAPVQAIEMKDIYNYSTFDGKNLAGEVIFLEPIMREQSVAIR